jgi:hypothetical protein
MFACGGKLVIGNLADKIDHVWMKLKTKLKMKQG